MHGPLLTDYEFLRTRKITRFVKGTLIGLLQSFSSTSICRTGVQHIVAFTAIFSNSCTAHAQKRLFINFRCKFRHQRSIPQPRFPVRVQNFDDLATFSVNSFVFYILNVRHVFTSGLFDLLTCKVYRTRRPPRRKV